MRSLLRHSEENTENATATEDSDAVTTGDEFEDAVMQREELLDKERME